MKRSSSLPAMMRLLLVLAVVPSFVHATAAAQIPTPFVRFSTLLLALLVSDVANSGQFFVQAQAQDPPPPGYELVGNGDCQDQEGYYYDLFVFENGSGNAEISVVADCKRLCEACALEVEEVFSPGTRVFRGLAFDSSRTENTCDCYFDDDDVEFPETLCQNLNTGKSLPEGRSNAVSLYSSGSGVIGDSDDCNDGVQCYKKTDVSPPPTKSPTKSPTQSPTSKSPTKSPTSKNPTSPPSQAPSKSPTAIPTSPPSQAPSKSPTALPTEQPTPLSYSSTIHSWLVQHNSTIVNFNKTSGDEITLEYLIGKGREPRVTLFESGCEDPLDLDSDGITLGTAPATTDIADDPDHSKFEVFLDVPKNTTVLGDLYADNILSFCVKVDLLNSDESKVIKYEKTDVAVTLDFENEFDIGNIILSQIYVGSDNLVTQVLEYVEACACNPTDDSETCADSAKVITDGNDSRLKVCIRSTSPEMEIEYLDRLVLQADSFADDFVIIDVANRAEGQAYDGETAEVRKYAGWNGVYAESVVPTSYFSYADDVIARVTGVVYLKLAGSSRRLAIDIELTGQHESDVAVAADATATAGSSRSRALQSAASDQDQQESAFVVNFELQKQKNDFELMGDADVNVNGAAGASMSSGVIAAAGIIGSAAVYITTMIMW